MAPRSWLARLSALFSVGALAATVAVGVASPASAADIGTLTINGATTGPVTTVPMFTSATTAVPCPTGYGTNASLRVARVGSPPPYGVLGPIGTDGGYDTAPISLDSNRSLARAVGGPGATTVPDGDYQVLIQCTSDTDGDYPEYFRSRIFTVSGNQIVPAEPTTATLTASPANIAAYGADVTLTAALSPAHATGTVTFKRGATTIGSAAVTGGSASVTVNSLPLGNLALSASFAPAGNFLASDSNSLPYQITVAFGLPATEDLNADIAPGAFTLSVAATPVTLTGGAVGGQATGTMNPATVTDLRGNGQAWNLTGQVSDFTSGANTIPANNLGWTPNVHNVDSETGNVLLGAQQLPLLLGLGAARTLCHAAAGTNAGVFECGASLTLKIPQSARPGAYAATLTLTLI